MLECIYQFCNEFVINIFLNEYSGASTANLSLIKQDTKLYAVDGSFPVAVVENNICALAAKFQSSRNQFVGSSQSNVFTNLCRTCESKFTQIRVI